MSNLAAYNQLNQSFRKKYIFNFGSEGGFYSEFNNMVFGMVYCLKYKYQFILYSGNSQFKVAKGWDDFFEPFCDSVNSSFHKKFNKRMTSKKLKLKHYPRWRLYRLFNRDTYLTYELFHSFFNESFEKEEFDIPELRLKGNLRDVSREIVKMIYQFNSVTKNAIDKLIAALNLPARYVSVNIRRGDKDMEFNFMHTSAYMDKLAELSAIKDVFVLTDDYSVIEEMEGQYPDFRIYTLVNREDRGYIHADFIKQSVDQKKDNMIRLFASIEIMRAAELAIGAYTNTPGIFLGMTMPEDKFVSMQRASWYQFDKDDVKDYMIQ